MNKRAPVDPNIFIYVLDRMKTGSGILGLPMGEVAARARQFEAQLNAWIDGFRKEKEEAN